MIAFVLSSRRAALASIVYASRLETGTPVLGQRVLLDVIGAAVIGGVSLFGGRGKIAWVILGVLFLSIIDKGLQLLGITQLMVFAVKGGVVLLAAILDAMRNRFLIGGGQTSVSPTAPLLSVEGLRKSSFGAEVLKGVSFTL